MDLRYAMADLTQRLLDLPFATTGGLAAALLSLYWALRVLRWAASQRNGDDYDDMRQDVSTYRRRISSAPDRIRQSRRRP